MRTPQLHTSLSTPRIHRVLLLSSHHCNWVGLRTILEKELGLHIVAEVRQADEVVPTATKLHPDVIFAPVELGGATTVPLLAQVRACHLQIKLLVLGHELDHNELIQLGQTGIDGYLLWKSLSPLMLHHCLAAVLEAGLWVGSPAAVARLVSPPDSFHTANERGIVLSADHEPEEQPTPRELAVLRLVEEGHGDKAIARQLCITPRTVDFHLRNLFRKLGATSRTEAIHRARQRKWLR